MPAERRLGDTSIHPVAVIALVALVLNDHAFKQRWPSWWTGKLSDVAGLVLCPLLLISLVEWSLRLTRRTRRGDAHGLPPQWLPAIATAATVVGFMLAKLTVAGSEVYDQALGTLQWLPTWPRSTATATPVVPMVPVSLVRDPDRPARPADPRAPLRDRRQASSCRSARAAIARGARVCARRRAGR